MISKVCPSHSFALSVNVSLATPTASFYGIFMAPLTTHAISLPKEMEARGSDGADSLRGRRSQVVLLEDHHEDVNAWHERPAPPPPAVTGQGSAFAMSLTFVVSAALVLVALLIAYGPAAMKAIKLAVKGGSASVRPKGSQARRTPCAQSKKDVKSAAKSEKQSLAKKKAKGLRSVPDEDDESSEEEDDNEEEEDDDEEEEEDEEDLRTRYPLGSEALAINLKDKKHLVHNKKVGIVKKVDQAAGKIYLMMKGSNARLVLKSANVQPVSRASKPAGKRRG